MVNTEPTESHLYSLHNYNILNIVVNTEPLGNSLSGYGNYNILNIVVNTEQDSLKI